jgi:sugar phosphate isomerase/epimerase
MNHLTRRQFGLGLFGAAAARGLDSSSEKPRPSVIGGVQIGVQSYSFRKFKLDEMIEAMKTIGLSSVELSESHLHPMKATEADFKAAKKRLDTAGIRISAYYVNLPADANDDHLDRAFNGALLLGTNTMTTSTEKRLVARLDRWCQKFKVKVGLHNHWFGSKNFRGDRANQFETAQDFVNALKGVSSLINIAFDIGHFSAAGFDPVSFIREHHDRIVSLHIKDRDRDEEHSDRRFGQGATPIAETMRLLKKIKYRYAANIEYEIEPEDPTDGVRHAFEYMKLALGWRQTGERWPYNKSTTQSL